LACIFTHTHPTVTTDTRNNDTFFSRELLFIRSNFDQNKKKTKEKKLAVKEMFGHTRMWHGCVFVDVGELGHAGVRGGAVQRGE
jgi:hypothetical protein